MKNNSARAPVVAGQFYSGTKEALTKEISSLIKTGLPKRDVIGAVSPHAGYAYSGSVAASVFSSIDPVPTYIIIGPNHTGMGEVFGLSTHASWSTPLGEVEIDRKLADSIKKNCPQIKDDDKSSALEHSIEVQLPFLQYLNKKFKFVPIVAAQASLAAYKEAGKAIAKSITESGGKVTIIASSDMTHYEPRASAKKKDDMAIDAILKLNEDMLIERIKSMGISMCGYAPVAIMLAAAKALGAKEAKLVKYETSGDSTGDYSSVVGYAGVIIY